MTSIASSLGIGSGLDTQALVKDLAAASRTPKDDALKARETANGTKVSTLAMIAGGIDSFASSLAALISSGSLFTQAASSDPTIVSTSAVAGGRIGNLSAQLEVIQLAAAQTIVSGNVASASDPIGQGRITLTTATGSFDIEIGSDNDSLAGLAQTINAANAGVTASVVQDSNGSRLVLKGATGDAQAFGLEVDPAAAAGLRKFAFDPANPTDPDGMTEAQKAQDAVVKLDGVEVRRTTNSFIDLIPGVKVDLKKAVPGTTIAIGASRQTDAIAQAVNDFVTAYNALKTELDAAAKGPLANDLGVREMQRKLSGLTSTVLSSTGGPATLAEIGVRTQRDGSLLVDNERLNQMLASDPDGVEALFNPGQTASSPLIKIVSPYGTTKPGTYTVADLVAASGGNPASGKIGGYSAIGSGGQLVSSIVAPSQGLIIEPLGNLAEGTVTVDLGLGGALKAIRDALRAATGPLTGSQNRLTAEAKAIALDREKMEMRETAYEDRLTKQFSAMDSRVAVYKATQSYLDQQIKMWTGGNN